MSNKVLKQRIATIPKLQARLLTETEYAEHSGKVQALFLPFPADGTTCQDISDLPERAVRTLLTDWKLTTEEVVFVLWLFDRAGVAIHGQQFIDHYDDLWYPSSDDVWIVDRNYDRLISLTHEEEICLVRPRQTRIQVE